MQGQGDAERNGWTDVWTDGRMYVCMDGLMDRCMGAGMWGERDVGTCGCMNDGQMNKWID